MKIEPKINETAASRSAPDAKASAPAVTAASQEIAAFLADVEPFFYRKPITYIDAGANRGGVFRALAASRLRLREAHLIEPSPKAFAALEATVAELRPKFPDAAIACHRLALGDAPGRLRLREQGTMTKVVGPAGETAEADDRLFEAECTTLDALAASFATKRISLLKLDVEGHEPQVLAGAAGLFTAQAIDLVYVEAGMNPEGGQQSYYREIEDRLRDHGYRLFRIYEQMHEWQEDSPLLRRVNLAFMSNSFAQRHPFGLTLELAAVRRDRDELKAGLKAEKAARAEAEAELARARADAAASAASLECRVAELSALSGVAVQRQAELAASRAAAAKATAEAARLRRYGRELEARHLALLGSQTWRVMEPVRRLLRLGSGKAPPQAFTPKLAKSASAKTRGPGPGTAP